LDLRGPTSKGRGVEGMGEEGREGNVVQSKKSFEIDPG